MHSQLRENGEINKELRQQSEELNARIKELEEKLEESSSRKFNSSDHKCLYFYDQDFHSRQMGVSSNK